MKRIKKILPVLLGVMVLMFGTLTVSAAEFSDADSNAVQKFTNYIKEHNFENCSYQVLFYTVNSKGVKEYRYIVSSKPLAYRGGVEKPFYAVEAGTSWNAFRLNDLDGSVVGTHGGTASSANEAFMNLGSGERAVVASNYDLYAHNGIGIMDTIYCEKDTTGFFPLPPVERALETLPEVVRGQTKVILTTAVVCLALLVILSVLPKKLPRFLNR